MLKNFSLLAVASAIVASPVVFAESQKEAEAKCKQWAQEERISEDEMNDFIAECVQSLNEEASKEGK